MNGLMVENLTTDERGDNKRNINIKELSRLFNLAKGYRNTSQFINDCGILYETQAIVDILNGKFNSSIRPTHLKKVAQVSEGRVKLEDIFGILGFNSNRDTAQNLTNTPVKRGYIYMVNLGDTLDSEQGGIRPALIISNNKGNEKSSICTIIPITSNQDKSSYMPTHVKVGRESGLIKDSIAINEQPRCISKRRLYINGEIITVGKISEHIMKQIETAIKIQFGLIDLQFNSEILKKMILAYISVNSCAKKIINEGLNIAKELLLRDIIDYCNDYGKDYLQILREYNNRLIESQKREYKLCYSQ